MRTILLKHFDAIKIRSYDYESQFSFMVIATKEKKSIGLQILYTTQLLDDVTDEFLENHVISVIKKQLDCFFKHYNII